MRSCKRPLHDFATDESGSSTALRLSRTLWQLREKHLSHSRQRRNWVMRDSGRKERRDIAQERLVLRLVGEVVLELRACYREAAVREVA